MRRLLPVALIATGLACAPQPPAQPNVGALATFDAVHDLVAAHHYDYPRVADAWEAGYRELRPRAARAADTEALRALIREYLEHLDESHFTLIPATAGTELARGAAAGGPPGTTGLQARLVDGVLRITRVESGGPAERAGLVPGQAIRAIDDWDVQASLAAIGELPAGGERRRARALLEAVLARRAGQPPAGREIVLDIDGHPVALRPEESGAEMQQLGNLPALPFRFRAETTGAGGECIARIAFSTWLPAVSREMDQHMPALARCRGIIIDLRGNPGGVAGLVMPVAAWFVDEPTTMGTLTRADGEIHFRALPKRVATDGTRQRPYAGPLAIVVDGLSASTSEMFAAGLQAAGRARIFGSRTPGMALPAMTHELPNGDMLMIAMADYTAPDGRRIEGHGVVPDEPAPLDLEALEQRRDPALEAAEDWIRRQPGAGAGSKQP